MEYTLSKTYFDMALTVIIEDQVSVRFSSITHSTIAEHFMMRNCKVFFSLQSKICH